MTRNDLIVLAPWLVFAAVLAGICIRLLGSRRASRQRDRPPPPGPDDPGPDARDRDGEHAPEQRGQDGAAQS